MSSTCVARTTASSPTPSSWRSWAWGTVSSMPTMSRRGRQRHCRTGRRSDGACSRSPSVSADRSGSTPTRSTRRITSSATRWPDPTPMPPSPTSSARWPATSSIAIIRLVGMGALTARQAGRSGMRALHGSDVFHLREEGFGRPAHTLKVAILGPRDGTPPDTDAFARWAARALGERSPFRWQVHAGLVHLGRPMWSDATPHDDHVVRHTLEGPDRDLALDELLSRLAGDRLPRDVRCGGCGWWTVSTVVGSPLCCSCTTRWLTAPPACRSGRRCSGERPAAAPGDRAASGAGGDGGPTRCAFATSPPAAGCAPLGRPEGSAGRQPDRDVLRSTPDGVQLTRSPRPRLRIRHSGSRRSPVGQPPRRNPE